MAQNGKSRVSQAIKTSKGVPRRSIRKKVKTKDAKVMVLPKWPGSRV